MLRDMSVSPISLETKHTNQDNQETLSLVLVAIFKNESLIMKEWLDHYIREGVEKFYMIDNDSTDDYIYILQKYIDYGYVVLIHDATKHSQKANYNKYFLEDAKSSKWCIVCDLDEFIYSRNGHARIIDYLNTLPNNVNKIIVQWKMFGSNGYIEQPDNVIKSFTKRQFIGKSRSMNGKCIYRGSAIQNLDIHIANTEGDTILSDGSIVNNVSNIANIYTNEHKFRKCSLHINHYAVQSYSWFKNIKMTRGSASSSLYDMVRNDDYFKTHDFKDIEDVELSRKKYSAVIDKQKQIEQMELTNRQFFSEISDYLFSS
jgi:hypothetical protein